MLLSLRPDRILSFLTDLAGVTEGIACFNHNFIS
jgi:hypothetical protein